MERHPQEQKTYKYSVTFRADEIDPVAFEEAIFIALRLYTIQKRTSVDLLTHSLTEEG